VLILLSITGNYEPIVQAAEVAGQYGGHTIAVTAPDSRLALFDMIAYEVAEIRGEPAMESMRRIKYHLVRTRDADDSKPLGD
jgi:DNA-binding MurR/RpiR family transcriptional regulator